MRPPCCRVPEITITTCGQTLLRAYTVSMWATVGVQQPRAYLARAEDEQSGGPFGLPRQYTHYSYYAATLLVHLNMEPHSFLTGWGKSQNQNANKQQKFSHDELAVTTLARCWEHLILPVAILQGMIEMISCFQHYCVWDSACKAGGSVGQLTWTV